MLATKFSTNHFGIGAVTRMTGLSNHVIRAWERRYGAVKPVRKGSGTRRYSEADVERLKLLRDAVDASHRIGAIAALDDQQIRALLLEPPRHDASAAVHDALNAIHLLDPARLEQLLAREALALGPLDFCRMVLTPLLDRIGQDWASGELGTGEEHLATTAIKGALLSLLRFGSDRTGGDTIVFSTLPQESHEFGVLMAAVCAQDAGARVLYLGPDLPHSEIAMVARRSNAKVVGVSAALPVAENQRAGLTRLKAELPRGVEVWVGGRGWSKVEVPEGVRLVGTLEELRKRILRGSRKA